MSPDAVAAVARNGMVVRDFAATPMGTPHVLQDTGVPGGDDPGSDRTGPCHAGVELPASLHQFARDADRPVVLDRSVSPPAVISL